MRYKAEPDTEVAGVDSDGSVIGFSFDAKGSLELPDDYQEANKLLLDAGFSPEHAQVKEPQ